MALIWPLDPDTTLVPSRGEFGPRWWLPMVDTPAGMEFVEHLGIDLNAPEGEPVPAAGDAVVSRVQADGDASDEGEGNALWLDHGDGVTTAYFHLADPPTLAEGDVVGVGATIGHVGATGAAEGPHLCFQTLVWGVHQNPRDMLRRQENL